MISVFSTTVLSTQIIQLERRAIRERPSEVLCRDHNCLARCVCLVSVYKYNISYITLRNTGI